ncbi:hypothetical protein EYF80_024672 [Liparis tanakae]|uniref:Uncharacterized protein n=1 Tax=Liparis tanakae TaxID=230148 RepID=A0A4Z2HJE3_9TELE|nr:hypothetical protein EYF80_024672 [Liparis tanakae]
MQAWCRLHGRHGQPLVERLMLAEAHGEVDRHFGRLTVTPNGIEDSEEEEPQALPLFSESRADISPLQYELTVYTWQHMPSADMHGSSIILMSRPDPICRSGLFY